MKYFVLVYKQMSGALQVFEEFPEGAGHEALDRRFELELEYRNNPDAEVVVLGADSRSDLEKTHARYFKNLRELAAAS